MARRRHKWLSLLLAVVLLAACSGDSDSTADGWCELNSDLDDLVPENIFSLFSEAGLSDIRTRLDDAQAAAPDAISDDVDVLAGFFDDLDDLMGQVDYDIADAEVVALEALFTEVDLGAASNRVDQFSSDECGEAIGSNATGSFEGFGLDAEPGMTFGDLLAEQFADTLGLDADQADCVIDALDVVSIFSGAFDEDGFVDAFAGCGIAGLGGGS